MCSDRLLIFLVGRWSYSRPVTGWERIEFKSAFKMSVIWKEWSLWLWTLWINSIHWIAWLIHWLIATNWVDGSESCSSLLIHWLNESTLNVNSNHIKYGKSHDSISHRVLLWAAVYNDSLYLHWSATLIATCFTFSKCRLSVKTNKVNSYSFRGHCLLLSSQ